MVLGMLNSASVSAGSLAGSMGLGQAGLLSLEEEVPQWGVSVLGRYEPQEKAV